jgi:hypothetical protein
MSQMKGGNFIWYVSVLLLGCRPAQPTDDGDACVGCDAVDEEGESPTCDEPCAEAGAPAWCLELPGSLEHWIAIVGLAAHPNGNVLLLSAAADGTRELVEFTPQGTIVSTRELAGDGPPRAVASGPDGIYVATNMAYGKSSAIEHFSHAGDLKWALPIDRAGLLLTSIARHDGVLALAGTLSQSGSEDIWVATLDMTGAIRWEHTHDHAGLRDVATSVVFDGRTLAVAGNVQHAPPEYEDVPYPMPNFGYFAAHAALDGAVLNREIITGEQVEGILVVGDMAQFEDDSWALTGTSTRGLLQSVWWTAIVDTKGVRVEKFETALGDNVTEAVAAFGDAVLVAGRWGEPIPTTTRVARYDSGLSSLAWDWIDALPDDDGRDIVGDVAVVDASLYVSLMRDVQPLEGGNHTESLTVCNYGLL